MTTAKKKIEGVLPQELVEKILEQAGDSVVLVGGQSLAFWAAHYAVKKPKNMLFYTRDIDFLAGNACDSFEVKRFASILNGYAIFPSKHALTALIGQAIKEISEEEYLNIDILHKVLTGTEGVRLRAVSMTLNGKKFKVMHPVDVLASRLINLHKLPEKQNELGRAQLSIAINVMQSHCRQCSANGEDTTKLQHFLVDLSKTDAAKKVKARWGVSTGDAMDPVLFGQMDTEAKSKFLDNELPFILSRMSSEYAPQFLRAVRLAKHQIDLTEKPD